MIIKICNWNNCKNRFNSYVITRLKNDIAKFNLSNVEIEELLCMWMCEEWPIVKIDKEVLKFATPIKANEMLFRKINWTKPKKEKKKREDFVEDDSSFDENYKSKQNLHLKAEDIQLNDK
jgi:hypothetical protein